MEVVVRRGLWALFVVLSIVNLAIIWLPYEARHFLEFETISFSMLAARGEQPYHDGSSMSPIGFYGPLCYALPALIGRVSGMSNDPKLFFLVCRMTVFFFFMASIVLLWKTANRASKSPTVAILCLFIPFHQDWGIFSFRPDQPALLFVLGAFVCAHSRMKSAPALSGTLAAASFLYCQRYVSIALAIGICWIWMRRYRDAAYFLLAFGVTTMVALLIVFVWSGGALWTHMFVVPTALAVMSKKPFELLMQSPLALSLVVFSLCVSTRQLMLFKRSDASLASIYSVVAIVVNSHFMRSVGAAPNQLLEPIMAATLALVSHYGENRPTFPSTILKKAFVVLLIMIAATVSFWHLNQLRAELMGVRGRYDDTVPHESAIRRFVKGPLLSDSEIIAYRSGNPDAACDGWYYEGPLKDKNLFKPERVAEKISSGHYPTIVTRKGNSTLMRLFEKEIRLSYQPLVELDQYEIWKPIQPQQVTPETA